MPQPKYNNRYISRELFDFYQTIQQPYEGFVTGVGYAFIQKGAMMTTFSSSYDPSNPHCQGTGFFDMCTIQLMDSSPEAVVRSLNLKAEDFESHLVQKNDNGTLSINMGHGKFISLPQQGTSININIVEQGNEMMLNLAANNSLTGEFYSIECKLREYQQIFNHQHHNQTISLPSAANDYMPAFGKRLNTASKKGADISDLIGIGLFLAGEGNRYLESQKFRYKYSSVIENKPTHWYTENNQWYDINKQPNKYTGKRSVALEKASKFRNFGRGVFIGALTLSAIDLTMGIVKHDLGRSVSGGVGITVSVISIFCPVIGWIYTGYLVLNLIGAFDRPNTQLIRRDPYIIEPDNTRIVRPPIDTTFFKKKPLIMDIPQRKQLEFRQGRKH